MDGTLPGYLYRRLINTTLRSKIEKSKRARLVEVRKGTRTTVTFLPKTGRRRKTSDGISSRDS